ncbi:aldehyde dehydrogenase family protein [Kytococcus sp. Marseille-QA3725]
MCWSADGRDGVIEKAPVRDDEVPVTLGHPLAARSGEADVEKALDAAWKAAESWNHTTAAERTLILHRIGDRIEENLEKLAPALAAGNCVVIKPAEQTPASIMVLMEVIADLLPDGVVNVVNGFGAEAGKPLASNPRIRKIAFTGETTTGRLIMQYASENVTPVTLELGGKSPNVFFEDVMAADDGYRQKALEGLDGGFCVEPTIFRGDNSMRIFQEEIFGPVLTVTTFKDFDEAVRISNDTLYGLGAGVWSRDGATAYRAGRAIQAGRVWTNCYHQYPDHAAFGGYKQSGTGRENHLMMLDQYQQTKNLLVSYSQDPAGLF